MMRMRLIALLVASVGLIAMGAGYSAAEPAQPVQKQERLDRLAVKLQLDDKQKDEVRQIATDFTAKTSPLKQQLRTLRHDEHQAMKKVLTPEQQAKLPDAIKVLADQQFEKASAPLKLSDEQKASIAKIRTDYRAKFRELAVAKDKGENRHQQFRALRHEMVKAIRAELNAEQRDKLPLVLREQRRSWHNPASRHEFFTALGAKLGVSAEQKEQFRTLRQEYAPKVQPLHAELKKLGQEKHAAIGRVLTEEQKAKLKEMHQARLGSDKAQDKQ